MSFPYDQYTNDIFGQQQDSQGHQHTFPQWDTLSDTITQPMHSPLDTPASGTMPMQLDLEDLHAVSVPSPIDNTPILLHPPHHHPPPAPSRHAPRIPTPAPVHPIDAVIFGSSSSSTSNRPGSAAPASTTPPFAGTSAPSPVAMGVIRNPPRARTASATAGSSHPYYRTYTMRRGSGGTDAAASPSPAASFEPQQQQVVQSGGGSSNTNTATTAGRRSSAVLTRSRAKKSKAATTPHGGMMIERPPTRSSTSAMATAGPSSVPSPNIRPPSAPHFVPHDVLIASSNSPGTLQTNYPSPAPAPPPPPPPPPPTIPSPQAQPQPRSPEFQSQSQGQTQTQAHATIPRHRLVQHTIPSDMHYSLPTHTLSCSLELPGVEPEHVRVSLATCYFNHVKYVTVAAENIPPFPKPVWGEDVLKGLRGERIWGIGSGAGEAHQQQHQQQQQRGRVKIGQIVNPNLRERRFGIMRRMIQVPAYTTIADIQASLKNGVLTLNINCGKPFEQDDEQEVPIITTN